MENEEREVRGMAVVWKRVRALAVFLLVLSMLESDGIEQEIMRISIGYCAEGGSRLVSYGLEEDRFEDQNFIPVIYMYDNEAEMMDALAEEEISIALLDGNEIVFDNKMTDNRIILWLKIDNQYDTVICVRKHLMEENLNTAICFTKACTDENDGNVKVVPYLQWLDYLRTAGYAEEDVMPYLAPDFVDEMLEERHFDRM